MPQIKFNYLTIAIIFLVLFSTIIFSNNIFAGTSLGIGVNEKVYHSHMPLSNLYLRLIASQKYFEGFIADYLINLKRHPENAWFLMTLSFIYGIIHAIGPGHGKTVISSYLFANETSLKRGIILSFFSAILQALSAILIVLAVFFFLPARLTQSSVFLTQSSFLLILLLGFYLLWRKLKIF